MNKTTITALFSHQHDVLFQHYLDHVYHDIDKNNPHKKIDTKKVSETHGEISYASINKLLATLTLTENDIFVDLGSGLGKMVLQVYLQTKVREVYGIELLQHLYEKSLLAANTIKQETKHLQLNRKLHFILGNFLEISFATATVVFINSVCFGQDILVNLGKIINKIPSIHTVITLRPINNLQHVYFKQAILLEASWDSALCYIYTHR